LAAGFIKQILRWWMKKYSLNFFGSFLYFLFSLYFIFRGSIFYVSVFNFPKWKANLSHFLSFHILLLDWAAFDEAAVVGGKEWVQVVAGLMLMLINYTTAFKLKSSDDNSNEFNWKTVFRRSSRFAYKSVSRGAVRPLHQFI